MTSKAPKTRESRRRRTTESHARGWRGAGWGFLAKLLVVGLINAFGVMTAMVAVAAESWIVLVATIVLVAAADIVYFARRALALKYLFPGLAFLLVFQIFIFGYTAYIAFTNYGTGHAGSIDNAVEAALVQGERRVEGSETYPVAIVERGGEYGLAIADGDTVRVGSADEPLDTEYGAKIGEDGAPTEVPGWNVVPRAELWKDAELQATVAEMRVPVSEDPGEGVLRTREGRTGAIYTSTFSWDESAQTITDTSDGTVYSATPEGTFTAPDGTSLPAGWYVPVGFDNFLKLFTDPTLAEPLLLVAGWTFAFAALSVVLSFGLGLLFALIYNDPRVRARKFLRTLFILPYAFPAFMSALLFRGMFNAEFGVINDLFFFGANINWLGDPWLAKIAVLWINVWLSYPYWFLVCTGALQSLPRDTLEAASIDGAGKWRSFRSVVLPLLLVSTAPLAISSFAFNFNNFTVIYMFNNGGPAIPGAPYALGSTDILISAIYDISGISGGAADYGLASALSIIVFLAVGVISAFAFRQTRKLEEFQ